MYRYICTRIYIYLYIYIHLCIYVIVDSSAASQCLRELRRPQIEKFAKKWKTKRTPSIAETAHKWQLISTVYATPLMTSTTDLGLSIRLSMFELRETGDWDIFLGPPERARAKTGGADQWVFKRREC